MEGPLRWVVEDASGIGDCNQGGIFLPLLRNERDGISLQR